MEKNADTRPDVANKITSGVLYASFLTVCMLSGISFARAQHECHEFSLSGHVYQIGYGESVSIDAATDTHSARPSWSVSPQKGVSAIQGEGNSTGALVFNEPGTYEVTFTVPAHGTVPARTDKATVQVSGEKMKFLTDRIVFSKTLVKGQPADGIVLSVPVEIRSLKDKAVSYGPVQLQTTGVTGIVATLDEPVRLKSGMNTVSFRLSGTPEYAGPAQLGFFNPMGEGFFLNFKIAE